MSIGNSGSANVTAFAAVLAAADTANKNVYVPPGTYTLNHYSYPARSGVVISGYPYPKDPRPDTWTSKFIAPANQVDNNTFFTLNGWTNCEWRYLDIDGNNANQTIGNHVFMPSGSSSYLTWTGCYIHDAGKTTEGGLGIASTTATYVYVNDCTFYENANDIEPMGTCHHWYADNNYCSYALAEGLLAYGTSVHDVYYTNNTIEHARYGMSMNGCYTSQYTGNTILNCRNGAVIKGGSYNCLLDNNTFQAGAWTISEAKSGIRTDEGAIGSGVVISNNHFYDWSHGVTAGQGVLYITNTGSGSLVISGNEIADCMPALINGACTFSGNTITGATSDGVRVTAASTGLILDGNEISGSASDGIEVSAACTNLQVKNNYLHNNAGRGANITATCVTSTRSNNTSGTENGNGLADNWDSLTGS